jgi:hypothetical protein
VIDACLLCAFHAKRFFSFFDVLIFGFGLQFGNGSKNKLAYKGPGKDVPYSTETSYGGFSGAIGKSIAR